MLGTRSDAEDIVQEAYTHRDTVLTATVADGRITAMFHVLNPDKLRTRGDHDVSENQRS